MSAVSQVGRQFRFTNKAFWRNPASAFFTFAFPLMFLVIFTALLGQGQVVIQGFELDTTTYYVGAMAAFGVVSACFTNIAIQTTFNRDLGILKRLRGTRSSSAIWSAIPAPISASFSVSRPRPTRSISASTSINGISTSFRSRSTPNSFSRARWRPAIAGLDHRQ